MKYYARFENVVDGNGHPAESVVAGPFDEFLQLTYGLLRSGPDGDIIADLIVDHSEHRGCWEYEGSMYSDIVLYAEVD